MSPRRRALGGLPLRVPRMWGAAILAGLWVSSVLAQWRPDTEKPLPPGAEVMNRVRESLHGRVVIAAGSLASLDRDGEVRSSRSLRIRFDWTGEWPRVGVEIRDAFGSPEVEATLQSDATGGLSTRVQRMEAGSPASAGASDACVPGLDVSWTDLSLGFLWWPGGVTEQEEIKLGRVCYVVRVPAPALGSPYAAVRLWIDAKESALLQADGLDERGERIRRLAVRSLRKSDDGTWMIKDFELSGAGRGAPRAVLSFDSVMEEGPGPAGGKEADPGEARNEDRDL